MYGCNKAGEKSQLKKNLTREGKGAPPRWGGLIKLTNFHRKKRWAHFPVLTPGKEKEKGRGTVTGKWCVQRSQIKRRKRG